MTDDPTNPSSREKDFINISKKVLEDIYDFIDFLEHEDLYEDYLAKMAAARSKKSVKKSQPRVVVTTEPLLKIATHAIKYANNSRRVWVEVIGLLAGVEKDDVIYVNDAYPMGSGNAISVKIRNPNNYLKVWNLIRKTGNYIVGWYHSHPGYDLFMSTEDIATQRRYQTFYNKSIALVFDPTLVNGKRWGFKIFRLRSVKKNEWHEVSYRVEDGLAPKVFPKLLRFIDANSLDDFVEHDR